MSPFSNLYKLEKTCTIPKLSLQTLENYSFPLLKENISNIKTKTYTLINFNSSISVGDIVGKIELYNKETLLCSVNIVLENKLIHNNWFFYFKKILSYYK